MSDADAIKMPAGSRRASDRTKGTTFAAQRRKWNTFVGASMDRERRNHIITLAAMALTAYAILDNRMEREHRQFRVLAVERDANGNLLNAGEAAEVRPLTQAQVAQRLRTWVYDTRSVMVDATAVRRNVVNAYAMTLGSSAASRKLVEFHATNEPNTLARTMTRYLYREVVLRQGDRSAQVDWCERTSSRSGQPLSIEAWRMTATYSIEPPKTEQEARDNPDGWFVVDFDWHRVAGGPPGSPGVPMGCL